MKILILLSALCNVLSFNSFSEDLKLPLNFNANPIADAGSDQVIYLTQTSTATLDGSGSLGDTYEWTEISTDYMSRGKITSPTSRVTTVTGLPQGVFYFRIKVTTGGISTFDSMKVVVDVNEPPKNAKVFYPFPLNNPDFVYKINLRDDTIDHIGYNEGYPYPHSRFFNTDGKIMGFIERGRLQQATVDPLKGKLYNTVIAGQPWGTNVNVEGDGYSRSQINITDNNELDTNKTYVIIWKFYFPQPFTLMSQIPDWGRFTAFDVHGNDDGSGQLTSMFGRDYFYFSDRIKMPDGSFNDTGREIQMLPTSELYNRTNTVRITYREGSGYVNQKAFLRIEVNGVTKLFRNQGQVGKTPGQDYIKITGIYDWRNLLVQANDTISHKRFSIVTEDGTIFELNNSPYVDAGMDQDISGSSTTLSGTANDDGVSGNGKIISYKWTKISGGAVSVSSPNSPNTNLSGLSAGIYEFQLKATDDSGIDGYDTVKITVEGKANSLPIAKAGADTTLTLPDNGLTISGSGTDSDGTIQSYLWAKLSGPASYLIVSPSNSTTNITGLEAGVYAFELTVKDNTGDEGKDTIVVSVQQPMAPIAEVGSDRDIELPKNSIVLPGSGSSVDGTIESYLWEQISGPAKSRISGADSAYAGAWDLIAGSYQFQLTVKDNHGLTGSKILNVLVNPSSDISPISDAGQNQQIQLPVNTVTLYGNATDEDGTIASVEWSKISGPNPGQIDNPNSATTTVSELIAGIYIFKLTATDNKGATADDTVSVIVNAAANIPPSALAGSDQNLILPANSVLLAGEGSDEDGTIEKYSWTKISGPASGSIENPLSPATNVSDLSEGIYQFELTVTDNAGAVATDTVAITIDPPKNIKPVADAGTDQALILPIKNSILYGSGNDQDGTIISYLWQQISGPSQINIENKDSAITKISTFLEGIYQFELTVIDNKGDVGNDTINIIVSPAINIAPIADAGADQTITLPKNNTLLSGNGIDQDGTIEKYSWAQIAGPAIDSIENPSSSSTNISGLSEGSYLFELSVSDNNGAIGKDTVTVTVLASKNTAPKAEAGANQTILLPNQNTILYGSGTDEDGIIEKYHWVQISGPSGIQIENSDSSYTNVNGLLQGTYQFELTVTDDMNSIGKDTVTIQVNSLINIAPVADAGADQEITLPVNNILVSGIGSDEDGTISGYSWKQIAGSQNAVIEDSLSATSKISNLTEGAYQFELTVTDNNGAVTKDSVEIVVKPAINIAPVADAGINQIITLPANSTILNGKGTDEDGNIANYEWKQLSGPGNVDFDNAKDSVANISGLLHGIYQFELKVTDDKGAFGTDTLMVQVNVANNIAPTADAGSDQSIELPVKKITLVGLGKDSDGTIAGYTWKKIFGSASGTILNPYSSNTDVDGLEEGIYQFELTVTDDKGDTGKDTVLITVNPVKNNAPLANAGGDQSIKLPLDNVNLSGTATDSDGTIVNAAWVKISGPADGNIETPNSLGTKVSGLSKGTYQFELTVTDNKGAIVKDTVEIKVNPADNILPVPNAGADQSITLPKSGLILFGEGKDEDGYITSFAWAKISGPGGEKIVYPNSGYTIITSLQEGTYQFELTVTDNKAAIAKDTMQIIVNPAENRAPAADAGSDQIITLPVNSTNLLGNGYDIDGTIASYKWEKISGPSQFVIENNTSSSTRIKELTEGDYELELTVTDDKGAIGKDTMMITVNPAKNINPSVSAGSDQEITLPKNGVVLIGTATDPDGAISKYSWTKISGPVAENINTADSVLTVVNGLTEGTYQFELTVTDNKGAVAKDTVQVKVNEAINIPPTANAGSNKLITLPINSVTLSGNGTDADGSIVSYQWTKISGPNSGVLNNANSGSATVVNLLEGTYEFELKVTDNKGAVAKDTMQVKVNEAINIPPTANAGSNKLITLPINSVTLSGNGTDADGSIVSYQWTKISGPNSGAINNANSASATATNLTEGTYQFELKVTDNKGAVAKDTVQVKVNEAINIPPTANAGSDKLITLPINSVTLSGSGADADGSIVSYQWTRISGPNSGVINNANSASATVINLLEGTYKFELKVTDNKGAVAKDTMQVKVNEAINISPTANAGSDKSITLPINSVTLSGSGADKDGSIVSYQWTKISGPSSGAINNANSASATATNLTEGTYQFELNVTDNKGAVAKDTMQVKVNEAINIPPTANAGSDKLITLPINSVTLSGSGADADGSIVSYQWTKISGPSSGAINNANSTSATATNLTEGTYQFELKVTDNKGTVAKDTMQVKVNEAINIPPTANAGSDKSITLPTNSVALSGSGSDSDGTIDSYSWVKISGPSNFSLNNSSSASANATGLVQGTYEFELTVKDNKGSIGKDVVKVVVNKAANLAPSANAGIDQSITLPANSVTLSGSGADSDGSVVSYQWTKISGPNSGAINNANSALATVTNLLEGNYQFVLTVQDNEGSIAKDTVKVIVNPKAEIPVVTPPTASAGKDTTILYPASTVTLAGTATKGSAEIASYNWKQLSGPSESVINAADKPTAELTDLKEGTYEFELQVMDKNGAIGRDSVKVTVALGRLAPQVNDTISVYPNPVHDITTADINTGRINTNVLITVTDISGKTIYKKQMLSTTENIKEQINMSNLTNGTYIITIFFDNVLRKSIKVVKL